MSRPSAQRRPSRQSCFPLLSSKFSRYKAEKTFYMLPHRLLFCKRRNSPATLPKRLGKSLRAPMCFAPFSHMLPESKATPHKCKDTHWGIAPSGKTIGFPCALARKSALIQAARQGLSARIRFANANMILNLARCFSSPRYRVFRKRSRFLTTPNTCSTFARTEDFACSAFFAAY